jgi:hypothetical protein
MGSLYPRYLRFCLEFAYSVELVWVTALLVQYGTPAHVDACIWIIPVLLSRLLAGKLSPLMALLLVVLGQALTAFSWGIRLPLQLEPASRPPLTRTNPAGHTRLHPRGHQPRRPGYSLGV